MTTALRSPGRYPALDGLRAVAIALVLVDHTVAASVTGPRTEFTWWSPGAAGVRLFFVLSGFLITSILLRARDEAEANGASLLGAWRAFYLRRALRIFPVAYVVMALAFGLRASQGMPWFFAYLGNFYAAKQVGFDSLTHFWSLAIEEQFYLVWPIVILALPRRWQRPAIVALILVAGALRATYVFHGQWRPAGVLPWTRMDALAGGGLMALVRSRRPAVAIAAAIFAVTLVLPLGWASAMLTEWGSIAIYGAIVVSAAWGLPGPIGRVLASRPLVYLGTISYGLYAWHPFVLIPSFGVGEKLGHPAIALAAGVVISVGIASLSWHVLERPFTTLKRFVPYVAPRVEAAAPSVAADLKAAIAAAHNNRVLHV